MNTGNPDEVRQRIRVVDRTIELLQQINRRLTGDLVENDLKVLHTAPSIAVIGLVSRGKSTLVNRLLGAEVQPTGPNPVTFGCGFFRKGEPRAVGIRADGARVGLPTDPDGFRHAARRHEGQDAVDFEYSWGFRLPDDVILIDTKGLDEVGADFGSHLDEMERSWAAQGAVYAFLVTAVPPGASARDVLLYRALHDHFDGRVTVVVKQVDSSLTLEELEEAATVWRSHGSDTMVIPDVTPSSDTPWGSGPLAGIERRMADIWARGDEFKRLSLRRVERELVSLAERTLPVPAESRDGASLRSAYQRLIADPNLLGEVRDVIVERLIIDYAKFRQEISDLDSLREGFVMEGLGSTHARSLVHAAVRPRSALRRNESLSAVVQFLSSNGSALARQLINNIEVSNPQEFTALTVLLDSDPALMRRHPSLLAGADAFVRTVGSEAQLVGLLRAGGDCAAIAVTRQLIDIWELSLDGRALDLKGMAVLHTALQAHDHHLRLNHPSIDQHLYRLFGRLDQIKNHWGSELTVEHHRNLQAGRYRPFAINRMSRTPFDDYNVFADRVETLLMRLRVLGPYLGVRYGSDLRDLDDALGFTGPRQRWLRNAIRASRFDIDNRESVTIAYRWAMGATALAALIALANESMTGGIFFGLVSLVVAGRLLSNSRRGVIAVRSFDETKEHRTFSEEVSRYWLTNLALVIVSAVMAPVLGSLVSAAREDRPETVIPVAESVVQTEPPPPVTEPPETTAPEVVTTFLRPQIDSAELTIDQFQDGRGGTLQTVDRVPGTSRTLSYVFVLAEMRTDLPDVMPAEACWVNDSDPAQARGCADVKLIRFAQVTDRTAFGVQVDLSDGVSPGVNRLRIVPSSVGGEIFSISTLFVSVQQQTASTTTTVPPSVGTSLSAEGMAYATAMAEWSSAGFERMMYLSSPGSPAWKYGYHLREGRKSELQSGRRDGNRVSTRVDTSGVRVCVTSSCDLRLSDFVTGYDGISSFNVNGRSIAESVIANSGEGAWICGRFGACATLRSLSWFTSRAYGTIEVRVLDPNAAYAKKGAIRLVASSGTSVSYIGGTTPDAGPGSNAHYSVAFAIREAPFGGEIRVKLRTALGLETLVLPTTQG